MSNPLTPAVAYIRMSSDKQEASPDQQRAENTKLVDGITVVDPGQRGEITEEAADAVAAFLLNIVDRQANQTENPSNE